MEINLLNLRNSINKAYLKVKPNRTQIETFKKNIINLFDQIKESESEEFHKNIISEFLKNTYYSPNNYINTKVQTVTLIPGLYICVNFVIKTILDNDILTLE